MVGDDNKGKGIYVGKRAVICVAGFEEIDFYCKRKLKKINKTNRVNGTDTFFIICCVGTFDNHTYFTSIL